MDFIDASGIEALMEIARTAEREQTKFSVNSRSPQLDRVLGQRSHGVQRRDSTPGHERLALRGWAAGVAPGLHMNEKRPPTAEDVGR
ncbi:MAG TPA: hypothetical protein VN108_01895, partial [Marmoricola sp.]|nr:hypothetical protein [Marmoricola sp.]